MHGIQAVSKAGRQIQQEARAPPWPAVHVVRSRIMRCEGLLHLTFFVMAPFSFNSAPRPPRNPPAPSQSPRQLHPCIHAAGEIPVHTPATASLTPDTSLKAWVVGGAFTACYCVAEKGTHKGSISSDQRCCTWTSGTIVA